MFTKHETESCFSVEATLRNFAPPEPFVVRWQHPLMVVDPELDPGKLKQASGKPPKYEPLKLLAVIKMHTAENPRSVTEWARKAKVPRNTLNNYLPEMRENGWIETIDAGSKARKYITEKGLKALCKD